MVKEKTTVVSHHLVLTVWNNFDWIVHSHVARHAGRQRNAETEMVFTDFFKFILFMDSQKDIICVFKILWIHKKLCILVHTILWIHKILAYLSSKFYGSIKIWHTYLQKFYGSIKFWHTYLQIFVDPQNFGTLTFKILWIHKILAHLPSQFCGSTKTSRLRKITRLRWKILWSARFPELCWFTKPIGPHICDKHHGKIRILCAITWTVTSSFTKQNNKNSHRSCLKSFKIHMGLLVLVFQT